MEAPDIPEIELKLLLEGIFLRYNYDFRQYSLASVRRRVSAALTRFALPSISQLQERALRDPDFFMLLLQYLTVPTSEMFRDPSYFSSLRTLVFPMLRTYPSIKVWVAGCSTGEEVYSLAILLEEEGLLDRSLIYATDINPISLKKAESGVFEAEQLRKFTVNYQLSGGTRSFADYYSANYDAAAFHTRLKKNMVFADHSLATDNVFSEVHLVSCRNVLIYFERELQDRAFKLFHEALVYKGYLGIGSKETLRFSSMEGEFETVSHEDRIYQKKGFTPAGVAL